MDWFVLVNKDLSLGHAGRWEFSPDVQWLTQWLCSLSLWHLYSWWDFMRHLQHALLCHCFEKWPHEIQPSRYFHFMRWILAKKRKKEKKKSFLNWEQSSAVQCLPSLCQSHHCLISKAARRIRWFSVGFSAHLYGPASGRRPLPLVSKRDRIVEGIEGILWSFEARSKSDRAGPILEILGTWGSVCFWVLCGFLRVWE